MPVPLSKLLRRSAGRSSIVVTLLVEEELAAMISVDTVEELREAVSNGGEVVALLVRRGNITHFVAVSPG